MVRNIISTRKLCFDVLKIDKDELLALAACPEIYYRPYEKVKKRKDGTTKIRQIEPSIEYLKWVQKRINKQILQPRIEDLPNNIMGGRQSFSTINNAEVHAKSEAIMKYDIKDFFPSIKYRHVYNIFRYDMNYCEESANILTILTTYNGHVPQGAPTSTSLAILAIKKMCAKLDQFCTENEILWSVWVDDITISGDKNNLLANKRNIDKIIKSMPFMISKEKETGVIVKGSEKPMTTTGITINTDGRLSLGRKKQVLKKRAIKAKKYSSKLAGKLQYMKIVDPKFGKSVLYNYKKKFKK